MRARARARTVEGKQATLREWLASPGAAGSVPFLVADGFVSHPLLAPRSLEHRPFQIAIAARALARSTLVVLPTGLGKTVVAVLVAAEVLRRGERVLVLAPTRPLALQHRDSFERLVPGLRTALFTGSDPGRAARWQSAQAVFATPQGLENDLEEGLYGLADVGLLVFDEAHRAVGDYSYVRLAALYREQRARPLVLGLTASPGAQRKRVDEVLRNLGIVAVESRSPEDEDVRDHVPGIEVEWVRVPLTRAMRSAQRLLAAILQERVRKLQRSGFLVHRGAARVGKGDLLEAGDAIRRRLARRRAGYLFGAMGNVGVAIQAYHCLELLETQGTAPLRAYLEKLQLRERPGRSERAFLKDPRLAKALASLDGSAPSHPKLAALVRVLQAQFEAQPGSLAIVFAQYRDTIDTILAALRDAGLEAHRFVGQATRGEDKGMSQATQALVLERFRRGEFRVLVASSVAEEGLDIPQVDLVVFYEPVVSEIRAIQRRGRTGRARAGQVVVLVAEKTRDEAYLHAEARRERKMESLVRGMGQEPVEAALEWPEDAQDPEEPG